MQLASKKKFQNGGVTMEVRKKLMDRGGGMPEPQRITNVVGNATTAEDHQRRWRCGEVARYYRQPRAENTTDGQGRWGFHVAAVGEHRDREPAAASVCTRKRNILRLERR
jgi:hypothetical protein